jgi:hypothetical protein
MNQEQKAQVYNQLMVEYTKLENQVSSIKGESFEMNESQQKRINELVRRMKMIESQAARL